MTESGCSCAAVAVVHVRACGCIMRKEWRRLQTASPWSHLHCSESTRTDREATNHSCHNYCYDLTIQLLRSPETEQQPVHSNMLALYS